MEDTGAFVENDDAVVQFRWATIVDAVVAASLVAISSSFSPFPRD